MKIASMSGSPTERSNCCCVPSPQSNRSRSPPARSRIAGSPRRAVGTDPAVPAKKIERSTRVTLGRVLEKPLLGGQLDERELDAAVRDDPLAHRVHRRAAALG